MFRNTHNTVSKTHTNGPTDMTFVNLKKKHLNSNKKISLKESAASVQKKKGLFMHKQIHNVHKNAKFSFTC